jgi:ABC-type multidrug transport system permease subunit
MHLRKIPNNKAVTILFSSSSLRSLESLRSSLGRRLSSDSLGAINQQNFQRRIAWSTKLKYKTLTSWYFSRGGHPCAFSLLGFAKLSNFYCFWAVQSRIVVELFIEDVGENVDMQILLLPT